MASLSRRFLSWDSKFTQRNTQLYKAENETVPDVPGVTKIEGFLSLRVHRLMPEQYSYAALREFLNREPDDVSRLPGAAPVFERSQNSKKDILFDERRDPSKPNASSSRYWAEYTQYPPEGDARCLEVLCAEDLFEKLKKKREHLGTKSPERRSIYIRDLSPLCALALVLPVAIRYAPSLREFLSKYITARAFFGVSIEYPIRPASTYTFEFHIPYFALRRSSAGMETFKSHTNRRTGEFQASFSLCAGCEREFFHEAQVSVLLVGIDEWVWTLYCLVETHFSETGPENVEHYIQPGGNWDAPSGEGSSYSRPVWNPREYFLLVLSRRLRQVRFEWANLVETLETRFKILEEDTFDGPSTTQKRPDDGDLKLTNDYTWAIQVLQLFSNQLVKTIEAWNEFADKHLHIFHPDETPANFLPKVQSYLESLDTDVSELRFIYKTIIQRIGAFESKRSNILNTSALVEARASNTQADNIGLLTKVTVFYLPLGLMTVSCQSYGLLLGFLLMCIRLSSVWHLSPRT
ncbi:hypothetical protein BJY00DRAFT_234757 [Aspergillus carlsbadensis]|nr:hypothetical protein BJY00DRAFT_234757 [Aspergillus carlsbadensis]